MKPIFRQQVLGLMMMYHYCWRTGLENSFVSCLIQMTLMMRLLKIKKNWFLKSSLLGLIKIITLVVFSSMSFSGGPMDSSTTFLSLGLSLDKNISLRTALNLGSLCK